MWLLRAIALGLCCAVSGAQADTAAGKAALARGDFAAAFKAFEPDAERGDPEAQTALGMLLMTGRGVPKDEARALRLIRGAATAGHANAQWLLGEMLSNARGAARNDVEAARWYHKAAMQGMPLAIGRYGLMLAHGRGLVRNEAEAVAWWRRGAEAGDPDSQGLLGLAYADGVGVAQDNAQAYHWLLLASGKGTVSPHRYQRMRDRVERELTPEQRSVAQQAAAQRQAQGLALRPPPLLPPAEGSPQGATVAARSSPPRSTGSGIVVAADRVVTNHHVVNGCSRLQVAGRGAATLLASDVKSDLALIDWESGAPAGSTPAILRTEAAQVGEPVTVVGYPLAALLAGINVTTGIVSSASGPRGDTRLLQITAPVQPGNSGGPLLDGAGRLIGVVVSQLNAVRVAQAVGNVPQNVNFAITGEVLSDFLAARGVTPARAAEPAPLTTQEIARRAQQFTVLIECWR